MSISHYQSWCLNSNLHQRAHLLPAWRACLRCQVSPFCDLTQLQFRFGGLRSSRCRRGRHPLDLISNLHRVSGTRVRTEMTTTRPAPSCITVYPRDITGPVMLAPERSSVFGLPPAGQRPIPPRMSCQRSSPIEPEAQIARRRPCAHGGIEFPTVILVLLPQNSHATCPNCPKNFGHMYVHPDVRVDATTLVLKKHIKKMDHSGQIKTPR